jgi:hypothetical protein
MVCEMDYTSTHFRASTKLFVKPKLLENFLIVEDYWVSRLYPLPITGAAYIPIIS